MIPRPIKLAFIYQIGQNASTERCGVSDSLLSSTSLLSNISEAEQS